MGKKKLLLSMFIVIFITIISSVIFYFKTDIKSYDNSRTNEILAVIHNDENNDTLDKSEIDEIYRKVEEIIGDSQNNNKELANGYYILGYLESKKLNYKKSNELLEKSLNYNSDSKLEFEIYENIVKNSICLEDMDKAEKYFLVVQELAIKNNFQRELVNFYVNLSEDLIKTNNGVENAILIAEKAIDIAKESKDVKVLIKAYYNAGVMYMYNYNLDIAMSYKLEVLKLCKENNFEYMEIEVLTQIGENYLLQRNYEEAINSFNEALNTGKVSYEQKSFIYYKLSYAYQLKGDLNSAEVYIENLFENLVNLKEPNKSKETISAYILAASLKTKEKNVDDSLLYLKEAEHVYSKTKEIHPGTDINLFNEYGDAYYEKGQYDKALEYHLKKIDLNQKRGIKINYLRDLEKISDDYAALGDYEKSYEYLKKASVIDSKEDAERANRYSDFLNKQFDLEELDKEIDRLRKDRRIELLIILLLVFAVGIVSFSTFIIHNKNIEIKSLSDKFKDASLTDTLTMIPNRRALEEFMNTDVRIVHNMLVSTLMIDVDSFKKYNDNYGHSKGDDVLKVIAKNLESCCNDKCFLCRYGGEEFFIIIIESGKEEAINIANAIKNKVEESGIEHKYSSVKDIVSVSIGITSGLLDYKENLIDFIKCSDKALYMAKESGKDKYVHIDFER